MVLVFSEEVATLLELVARSLVESFISCVAATQMMVCANDFMC